MAASVAHVVADLPRKRFAKATLRGEGPRKVFADLNLGRVVERMVELSGMTNEQAACEMGYESPSTLSRWIANVEGPNVTRIWSSPRLRPCFLTAMAEDAGASVEIETVVRIRRTA